VDSLTFAPVTALVALLKDSGLRADEDPAKLNLPGAWVTVDAIRGITLAGDIQLECSVFLIVGDRDYRRAYVKLADLYNTMATVLEPDGPVTPQGVVMPGTSTALPALRVPVNLI
jgi:hypothetical protein